MEDNNKVHQKLILLLIGKEIGIFAASSRKKMEGDKWREFKWVCVGDLYLTERCEVARIRQTMPKPHMDHH